MAKVANDRARLVQLNVPPPSIFLVILKDLFWQIYVEILKISQNSELSLEACFVVREALVKTYLKCYEKSLFKLKAPEIYIASNSS